MAEISPVKTPSRSIIRPLEVGSITPSAIEELSSQIDSLIQRGRKLRELKNSISRSPPKKSFLDIQTSSLDLRGDSELVSADGGVLEDILAVINASDPLFMEEARVPPTATSVLEQRKPVFSEPLQNTRPMAIIPCSYSLAEPRIPDGRLALRIRTKTDVSNERVNGDTGSDVAVEAWRGCDLVGIGRKPSSLIIEVPSKLTIDIWDVWEGSRVGQAVLNVEAPASLEIKEAPKMSSECIVLEPSIQTARSSIQPIDTYTNTLTLEDYLVKRNVCQPPLPPAPRVSTETFVSFLSESPARRELDLQLTSDSEESASDFRTRTFEEEALAHVESELSNTDCDLKSLLHNKIMELDLITNRLTGAIKTPTHPEIPDVLAPCPSDGGERALFPDVKRRRNKKGLTRRRRPFRVWARPSSAKVAQDDSCVKKSENHAELEVTQNSISESVHAPAVHFEAVREPPSANLSMVRTSLIAFSGNTDRPPLVKQETTRLPLEEPVRLSSKRKESIEKARRTISSLRKSFLKDADRMCCTLSTSSQEE